jgi:predicted nucleic acid-binding protein
MLLAGSLNAPHLMPVEVTNILRRAAARGEISTDVASMALADLLDLRVELFPFAPFAPRVWELRDNVTSYDAWYVALAESLGSSLATLDHKLAQATGPRCGFETPPDAAP